MINKEDSQTLGPRAAGIKCNLDLKTKGRKLETGSPLNLSLTTIRKFEVLKFYSV